MTGLPHQSGSGTQTITAFVPAVRLARYRQVAGGDDVFTEKLYVWAQRLSDALFDDIGVLEVVMRSTMARELASAFGGDWFSQRELFDDDAMNSIAFAWRANGLQAMHDNPDTAVGVIEAKLVSVLMFGFWVQLLGKGSHAGKPPFRQRRAYKTLLWTPALARAFSYAPLEQGTTLPSRSVIERLAFDVKAARNRIAHHEHIAWGIPLPGQGTTLSVTALHDRLLALAGCIDPDLRVWLTAHSTLAMVIGACPVDPADLNL